MAGVSQHNIFVFFTYRFQQIGGVLKEEKCLNVLQDPTGIFTNDESSFQLCPNSVNILRTEGTKMCMNFIEALQKHP